jgi:hypothetical protein
MKDFFLGKQRFNHFRSEFARSRSGSLPRLSQGYSQSNFEINSQRSRSVISRTPVRQNTSISRKSGKIKLTPLDVKLIENAKEKAKD